MKDATEPHQEDITAAPLGEIIEMASDIIHKIERIHHCNNCNRETHVFFF
jgi:hypothetical protein